MGFSAAVQDYFKNYVGFTGRAPRIQIWWILLLTIVLSIIARMLDHAFGLTYFWQGPGGAAIEMGGTIGGLLSLALLLPNLALGFRRMHDRDKSAWWLLLVLIPIVGWIILFVWMYCLRGTPGDNRFGPDPLAGKAV